LASIRDAGQPATGEVGLILAYAERSWHWFYCGGAHGEGGTIRVGAFVFACGPWLPKLFPDLLAKRIVPTRQEAFFFGTPPGDPRFAPPAMPVWIDFSDPRGPYGFPDLENRGVKIALDQHGPPIDPDTADRVPAWRAGRPALFSGYQGGDAESYGVLRRAAGTQDSQVKIGGIWCIPVAGEHMATAPFETQAIRRSISLPAGMAEKIDAIAAARHVSSNRAIVDLLSDGITAYEQRRTAFFELADRFQKSTDETETERLREELAQMIFGN
jgi:hypothetical protein